MKTRKPSHPLSHDRARISKALASIQPVRVTKLPDPIPGRPILEAGAEIVAALDRSMKRKLSYIQQRLPVERKKHKPVGSETAERARHAPEGVQTEQLSHNEGHQRARIRSPMALYDERIHRAANELAAATEKRDPDEPLFRSTKLDRALDHGDGPVLRWALSRYVVDLALIASKTSSHDGGQVHFQAPAHSRSAYNGKQEAALARIAFVKKHLGYKDRVDLDEFSNMIVPHQSNSEPVSMAGFGLKKTGLGDDRIREGVSIGVVIKIAERLHDIYRLKDLPRALMNAIAA